MCAAFLISASYDKQIRFWDGASGRTVRCFSFQDSQVNALLLIPDTTYLVVAGFGVLRVYDIGAANNNNNNTNTNNNNNAANANTAGGGGGGGTQAPPLFSSYENSSAMNMTSLGSFPLHSLKCGAAGGTLFAQSIEGSNSSLFNATLDLCSTQRPSGDNPVEELVPVLYATSEDGHIRFFSVNATTKLKLIRDISTGAAITCSAISPNRQTLLTGSQIGRVSVWHLPSIIEAATQQGEGSTDNSFGYLPLQEITFDSDYTAIRSIAIEPLARWAVAATNAGKLHFLRFEGEFNNNLFKSKDENTDKKGISDEEVTTDPQGADQSGATGSCETTTGSAVKPSFTDNSCIQPGSVYRSAVVSNEIGNSALKSTTLGSAYAGHSRGSTAGILVDSLDPSSLQVTVSPSKSEALLRSEMALNTSIQTSPLRQQFYMKVFHSFQAHYKYILKVAISPNTDLLVTCCADYTVGRFLIPPELQQGDQLKLLQREDIGPSSSHESDPTTSTTIPIDSYPADVLAATYPTREEKTQEAINTSALLHPVKSGSTKPTVSEKQENTTDIQPTDITSDNAEKRKTNTTIVDPADAQPSTQTAAEEKPASVRPVDVPDASSMLFSVIPSVSMEGQNQSHPSGVLQFRSLKPMVGHTRWVWDCVFSDCGRFLFTASSDQCLRMWTGLLADRVQSTCYVGHTKPVICCILYYEKKRNQF
ncbi:WD repeat-containing protein wat1 [Trypanosoma theileri]|uniref:Target of rapamycin complex subunit LST8 n=1 Tax=Trypanosoma theileri TaxID=67003 RepID=A0A1X0P678_9TRYP|nr:WD repeat-containing protein wat1 [Trypanosoma theileri]ORC92437.1 WD repeat-containing protein wat1 [Trypanosoma theileri]